MVLNRKSGNTFLNITPNPYLNSLVATYSFYLVKTLKIASSPKVSTGIPLAILASVFPKVYPAFPTKAFLDTLVYTYPGKI